ncbi:hypothetical protein ES288_A03G143900v1 [Gossypium darwinii]|uniref:Uncharacterized protein n=1 Tax=Gossypium darwinii TaxID=34276 RepID=A0A5D2H4I5_GOSDA|nr:hypothetical protein ES288_A03G143900v1 [Gossypium darwinii]
MTAKPPLFRIRLPSPPIIPHSNDVRLSDATRNFNSPSHFILLVSSPPNLLPLRVHLLSPPIIPLRPCSTLRSGAKLQHILSCNGKWNVEESAETSIIIFTLCGSYIICYHCEIVQVPKKEMSREK